MEGVETRIGGPWGEHAWALAFSLVVSSDDEIRILSRRA